MDVPDRRPLTFDIVLVGSLFNGGSLLIEPMRATIHSLAPGARLVRLEAPPVVGAVLLGMEQTRMETVTIRARLAAATQQLWQDSKDK